MRYVSCAFNLEVSIVDQLCDINVHHAYLLNVLLEVVEFLLKSHVRVHFECCCG